jgi:DNA polymerase-3 subunit epsilon
MRIDRVTAAHQAIDAIPADHWHWSHHPLAVIDLETTGVGSDARIVEIAVINVDREQVTSAWSSLVNPGVPMPAGATAKNGITDEMLVAAPQFQDITDELGRRLRHAVPVAHNAPFDSRILRSDLARCDVVLQRCPAADPATAWIDTLVLSRRHLSLRRNTLESVAKHLDIKSAPTHRALDDAWAALYVLLHLERRGCLGHHLADVTSRQKT